jgi:sigma-E factor negative regulatory protein RseA
MRSIMKSVLQQAQPLSGSERVSAIMDGEDADAFDAWIGSVSTQDKAVWTAFHTVGDILRSEDLGASGDAFMSSFAARFAREPHLLAPRPAASVSATLGRMRRRALPAFAVAAAAASLTWVVVPQLRRVDDGAHAVVASRVGTSATGVTSVALVSRPVAQADAPVARDARLDEYLEAHQPFSPRPSVEGATPFIRAAVNPEGQ